MNYKFYEQKVSSDECGLNLPKQERDCEKCALSIQCTLAKLMIAWGKQFREDLDSVLVYKDGEE